MRLIMEGHSRFWIVTMLCIGFPIGFALMLFRKKALRYDMRGGA